VRQEVHVERSGAVIRFRAGPFRSFYSWDLLFAISSGRIEVDEDSERIIVRLELRFTTLLFLVCLIALGVVSLDLAGAAPLSQPTLVIVLLLVLAFSLNVALASSRFFLLLSRMLDSDPTS
jgi:hypothetical protein